MPVRTRSQSKVLYNVRLSQVKAAQVKATEVKEEKVEKVEPEPVAPAPEPKVKESALPESKLPLGIWFVASLKKYNRCAQEITAKALKYKLANKYHAFRELRFEHIRIVTEMYSLVVEYFDEVMEAEPEVFVHYEELLGAHITEATCKFKYYLPKTKEECLIFKTFVEVILEASAKINGPMKYAL
jgi:hypothetical protein